MVSFLNTVSNKAKHKCLIIPGLGDNKKTMKLLAYGWKKWGIFTYVHSVGWYDRGCSFDQKLEELVNLVDELNDGTPISVVGVSAGVSAALNIFAQRSEVIRTCVNICGPVRFGNRRLCKPARMKEKSMLFAESVSMAEKNLDGLDEELRSRVLTIYPRFGDELIQRSSVKIEGAKNIEIPVPGHRTGAILAMTVWGRVILDFIMSAGADTA